MDIKIHDYILRPSERIDFFDLSVIKTTKSGPGKGKTREEPLKYCVELDRCFQSIIQDKLIEEEGEVDFPSFLKEYKRVVEETLSQFREVFKK